MFADNSAFREHNYQDALKIITCFLKSAKAFKLKINLKKTNIVYQPPSVYHDIGQDKQISGLHSCQQQQIICKTRYMNVKCFQGL